MSKNQTVEQCLRRNKSVAKRLELATAACMVGVPVTTISLTLVHQWNELLPLWAKAAASIAVGMIMAWPGVKIVALLGRKAIEKWAPSWVVDASEPQVVTIKGAVPFTQWHAAQSAMLKARSGYTMCEDALERFGCIMAAVPREQ